MRSTALEAYGARVAVRASSAALLAAIQRSLPWCSVSGVDSRIAGHYSLEQNRPGTSRRYTAFEDGLVLTQSDDLDTAIEYLESVIRLRIAEHAARRVFVHAGVVGWNGRAILIPARSFAGKSTLVAALVERGAVYYSDEYAVCDARGRVHPFARTLNLRADRLAEGQSVPAAAIRAHEGKPPLPVGLVVITKFTKSAVWRPRPVSRGAAALELLDNTVSARRSPEKAIATLQKVVAEAQVLKSPRGEAALFAETLLRRHADW